MEVYINMLATAGITIFIIFFISIFLLIDYEQLRLIKFRRLENNPRGLWEIAFSEEELFEKLNGEFAEIKMPGKCLAVRVYRKFFPLKGIEIGTEKTGSSQKNE